MSNNEIDQIEKRNDFMYEGGALQRRRDVQALVDAIRLESAASKRVIEELVESLKYAEEYFKGRADAQYFPDSSAPVPNTEMSHFVLIRESIVKAKEWLEGGK